MVKRQWFDTEQEAEVFAETIDNLLDVAFKKYGTKIINRQHEEVKRWAVEWDEPTYKALHPARPIEL